MSEEKDKNEELSFEDILLNIREKYNLDSFDSEDNQKSDDSSDEPTFYNPSEDREIEDFFKNKEEKYESLFEEVDSNVASIDTSENEEEKFNLNFNKNNTETNTDSSSYNQSGEVEYEDIDSGRYDESENDFAGISDEQPIQNNEKKISVSEIIRKIVLVISVIAIIGSSAWLANDYIIQPLLNKKANTEISDVVGVDNVEKSVEILEKMDDSEKEKTFDDLSGINKDFKCWLVVPGADVSLPVVQTNNNDKYLKTGFKGGYLAAGTLFIDCYNKSPFTKDQNTVIYGHNMRDGSMFGSFRKYQNVNTYKKNPMIYIYTPKEKYIYKIISVYLTNADPKEDNGYVLSYTFKNISENSFASYLEEIEKRSFYHTGVDVQSTDKILTLQTCDRTVLKNGRLIIVARLIREGESEAVDISKVSVNNNIKYPNAWYAKKGIKNPYKKDVKWIAN